MNVNKKIFSLAILACLIGNARIAEAENGQTIQGKGTIEYEKHDWETKPLDPEKPENEVELSGEYGKTTGPLRLDVIPTLNFGQVAISSEDKTYHVNAQLFKDETPARGNYVQVTDTRGTLAGWQLAVKQEKQFVSQDDEKAELKGAILSFDKQWANSTFDANYAPKIAKDTIKIDQMGTTYPVATAEVGKGSGTWTIEFGSSEATLKEVLNADKTPVTDPISGGKPMYKNQAITLFVPGKTKKEPKKYQTVLTWTISELPQNE